MEINFIVILNGCKQFSLSLSLSLSLKWCLLDDDEIDFLKSHEIKKKINKNEKLKKNRILLLLFVIALGGLLKNKN